MLRQTISSSWRRATQDVVDYCSRLARAEVMLNSEKEDTTSRKRRALEEKSFYQRKGDAPLSSGRGLFLQGYNMDVSPEQLRGRELLPPSYSMDVSAHSAHSTGQFRGREFMQPSYNMDVSAHSVDQLRRREFVQPGSYHSLDVSAHSTGQYGRYADSALMLPSSGYAAGASNRKYEGSRWSAPQQELADEGTKSRQDYFKMATSASHFSPLSAATSQQISSQSPIAKRSPQVPPSVSFAASPSVVESGSKKSPPETLHPASLFIPSDTQVLDAARNFVRGQLIQIVEDDKDNRIGLCCFYCRWVCFPSNLSAILDDLEAYQRVHLARCLKVPEKVKTKYAQLSAIRPKKFLSRTFLREYYAEAARELGLVESANGLVFDKEPKGDGPSPRFKFLLDAYELFDDFRV